MTPESIKETEPIKELEAKWSAIVAGNPGARVSGLLRGI